MQEGIQYKGIEDMAKDVVNVAYNIHVNLGPGLLESVYEEIMSYELGVLGYNIRRQQALPVVYKDVKMDLGFRTDIIIENKIIVEIKSIDSLAPVHSKQLLTYLRLTNIKLGFLINFNENLIKDGIHRIVNKL